MAVFLVLGLMFSMVLLSGVLIIGLGAFGYFWWKTREIRKRMKAQAAAHAYGDGSVIEGEAVIVENGAGTGEALRGIDSLERRH